MKINTLKEMVGAVVPEVTGEVIKLWPRSEGINKLGKAFTKQSGTLRDETGEVDFTIWSRTELPQSIRGVTMTIKAGMGVKGGLKDLKVSKHYKDPNKLVLEISEKAIIQDKENSIQEDAKDDLDMSPPSENRVEATKEPPFIPNKKAWEPSQVSSKSPQERIAQFGKLYAICMSEASDAFPKGMEVPLEVRKDVASCMFIAAQREGLADKMEVEEKDQPF